MFTLRTQTLLSHSDMPIKLLHNTKHCPLKCTFVHFRISFYFYLIILIIYSNENKRAQSDKNRRKYLEIISDDFDKFTTFFRSNDLLRVSQLINMSSPIKWYTSSDRSIKLLWFSEDLKVRNTYTLSFLILLLRINFIFRIICR